MKIPISDQVIKQLPPVAAAVGVIALLWWIFYQPTHSFNVSEPGRDKGELAETELQMVNIGEHFQRFAEHNSSLKEKWPKFRGGESDNIVKSSIPLKNTFGNQPPAILWEVELGEGHGGAAIYEGLVYILDYDEDLRADMLRCFVLETGQELWRRWYNVLVRRNHGMSRTIPAVTEDYIVTIGPRNHVMCVRRQTGEFLWGLNIERDYESEVPLWYTGQCPVIENGVAIIATGGKALMIGVDCETGNILWETPNSGDWKMSHSSIMPFQFGGRRMYVYSASGGVAGVAADGPDVGTILWQTSQWNHPVVAASPVCMPDGKIFVTAGYGAGSMLFQLSAQNGSFNVDVIMSFRPGEGLSSEQQTPVLIDGYLFGVLPKDARTMRNQMICVKPNNPTQVVWASGPTARFGLGPYILADGKFYLLDDDATLVIIRKSVRGYEELDRIKLFDGHDAWAPLAIADGYMVLRDADRMICIDMRR